MNDIGKFVCNDGYIAFGNDGLGSYNHIPPILWCCSKTVTFLNPYSFKFLRVHIPLTPAPMMQILEYAFVLGIGAGF